MLKTKEEKTNTRPSEYSKWHRNLGEGYYSVDIDYVEYRNGRGIVGLFAVTGRLFDENHLINSKKWIWKRTELERKIMLQLAKAVGVKAYYVIHTSDLSVFHVHEIGEEVETKFVRMNQEEYEKFVKSL